MDTRSSDVLLEIHQEWRMWNGYPMEDFAFQSVYLQYSDPMDRADFDETCAFPSLKPNNDVFRPPRRSRTQRGWYHVKSWPPTHRASKSRLTRTSGTGADIPPELFEHIVEAIAPDHRYRALATEEKRVLGACALVSLFWADKCQPMLFSTLALRLRADVLALEEFDKDPGCRFLRYETRLDIVVRRLVETQWIHLMSRVERKTPFDTRLEGPLPTKWKSLRSIHQAVPRTLPSCFSQDIIRLVLVDIRFQKLHDLMHLVGELPHLETLRLEQVSWGPLPTTFPRQKASTTVTCEGRGRRAWSSLTMLQCSPTWAQAALYMCTGVVQGTIRFFSQDDLSRMLTLLRLLEAAVMVPASKDVTCHAQFTPVDNGKDMVLFFSVQHPLMSYTTRTQVSLDFKSYAQHAVKLALVGTENSKLSYLVHVVALFIRDLDVAWKSVDWNKIDDTLCSFPCLRIVVIGLETNENLRRFQEEIVNKEKMPLSAARNKLRYAVRNGQFGQWVRAPLPRIAVTQSARKMHLVDVYD